MVKAAHSSSSSIDSSNHPCLSSAASSTFLQSNTHLSTDLSLGIGTSTPHHPLNHSSGSREKQLDWPPIKSLLRSQLSENGSHKQDRPTFFVKVYMEGIPIGRKLDLFRYDGYDSLVYTLGHMFETRILFPLVDRVHTHDEGHRVLTYEDKEGDWMMVGDVPWKVFLATVKRLKISGAHK